MSIETKHTPTPWIVSVGGALINGRGYTICSMTGGYNESDADRDFIVRACNAHDKFMALADRVERVAGCRTAECSIDRLWGLIDELNELAAKAKADA